VTAYLSAPLPHPDRLAHPVTIVRAAASPSLVPAWRTRIDGVSDERTVPGDHYSMLRETGLAQEIQHLAK
jgi:hypothetical protein